MHVHAQKLKIAYKSKRVMLHLIKVKSKEEFCFCDKLGWATAVYDFSVETISSFHKEIVYWISTSFFRRTNFSNVCGRVIKQSNTIWLVLQKISKFINRRIWQNYLVNVGTSHFAHLHYTCIGVVKLWP